MLYPWLAITAADNEMWAMKAFKGKCQARIRSMSTTQAHYKQEMPGYQLLDPFSFFTLSLGLHLIPIRLLSLRHLHLWLLELYLGTLVSFGWANRFSCWSWSVHGTSRPRPVDINRPLFIYVESIDNLFSGTPQRES